MSLIEESSQEVVVNLLQNSNHEYVQSFGTVVWTNHIRNPSFRVDSRRAIPPVGSGCTVTPSFSYGVGGPYKGMGYQEAAVLELTGSFPTVRIATSVDNDASTMIDGQVQTFSTHAYSISETRARIEVTYSVKSTGQPISTIQGPNISIPSGSWVRLSVSSPTAVGANTAQISVIFGDNTVSGVRVADRFRVSGYCRTTTDVLTPFFDGDSEDRSFDIDMVSVWRGSANNAPSEARGFTPMGGRYIYGSVAAILSRRWGRPTLRLIRCSWSPETNYDISYPITTPSGTTYAFGYYSDDVPDLAAPIFVGSDIGGARVGITIGDDLLPEAGQWEEYSGYIPDSKNTYISVQPPREVGSSVWYTPMVIANGEYESLPIFYGGSPDTYYRNARVFPTWDGLPGYSTSRFTYYPNDQANKQPIATEWNAVGRRYYEAGVDRGMLYTFDGKGVPWNGLTAVNEAPRGGDSAAYYIDGVKYLNLPGPEEYGATLKAFTYPDEFEEHDGTADNGLGLLVMDQPRKPFGLSYRTMVGNDVDGVNHAYKLHLIYNVLASPTDRDYQTLSDQIEPMDFSWALTVTPEPMPGLKSTAHLIVDSRRTDPFLLRELEEILYGTKDQPARMPTGAEIREFFDDWITLLIIDHGDGTYTASGPDDIIKIGADGVFEIDWKSAVYTSNTEYTLTTL